MAGKLDIDLEGVPSGARLYMALSGGLDSAYLGWRLLTFGYRMVFHHCSLKTPGNRWRQEDAATDAILDWYQQQGLTQWERLNTAVDVRRDVGYRLVDQETILWIASVHLRPYDGEQNRGKQNPLSDVEHIVFAHHYEATAGTFGDSRFDRAWQMFELLVRRSITPINPMYHHDKQRMIRDMPRELLDRCWWCREPQNTRPCGRCWQCRQLRAAFAGD